MGNVGGDARPSDWNEWQYGLVTNGDYISEEVRLVTGGEYIVRDKMHKLWKGVF